MTLPEPLDLEALERLQRRSPFPHVIDNTMRSAFVACERKWGWQYDVNIVPRKNSIHLHAGGAYAKGLEEARRAVFTGGHNMRDALALGAEAVIAFWGEYEDALWSWSEGADPQVHRNKTLDAVLLALEKYWEAYPPITDPLQPVIEGGRLGVEFGFALPFGVNHPETGEPLLYAGRYDMLGMFHNQLFVVDDKTTSQLGPTWSDQWHMRSQFTGYCWGARSYGYPVAGAIIRGMAFLKNEFKTQQAITYREDWKIDRWHKQLVRDVERMKEVWQHKDYNYDLADACSAYGGCPYRMLCNSAAPERWIGEYVENTWNPVEHL